MKRSTKSAFVTLLLLVLIGAIAFISSNRDSTSPTTRASITTPSGAIAPSATSTPSGLPYQEAHDLGLLRNDAVSVIGPAEVRIGSRPTSFSLFVRLPAHRPASKVEVQWSGGCTLASASAAFIAIPAGASKVPATVEVQVPDDSSACDLRMDALFPGRPYTGAGTSVRVRR